tara:strand:+ start:204 stop:452 length:249 start_codon:yes stop_codon:yes gene_type:complete
MFIFELDNLSEEFHQVVTGDLSLTLREFVPFGIKDVRLIEQATVISNIKIEDDLANSFCLFSGKLAFSSGWIFILTACINQK